MIPVLVCPVVSRFDLLERMLGTIDYPVSRLVIVDNSLSGYELPSHPENVEDIFYIRPIYPLGYPGGINIGVSQTPDAPWWMWASNDMTWGPGDLKHIASLMDEVKVPRLVTGDRKDDRLLRFTYGAFNAFCIEAVGLHDEWSFYPIYLDDDDYEYRCRQGGVEWVEFNGQMGHNRSSTIASDEKMRAGNTLTFEENYRRYLAKWGGGPGGETFSTPWNKPVPLGYAPVDIAGRARRRW